MLSEAIGEGLDDGVEPSCSHGCHVEDATDGLAATTDAAFAFHGAAVSIEGSQANEGGYLLTIELADLGDVGHDGSGGDLAEPGTDRMS